MFIGVDDEIRTRAKRVTTSRAGHYTTSTPMNTGEHQGTIVHFRPHRKSLLLEGDCVAGFHTQHSLVLFTKGRFYGSTFIPGTTKDTTPLWGCVLWGGGLSPLALTTKPVQ